MTTKLYLKNKETCSNIDLEMSNLPYDISDSEPIIVYSDKEYYFELNVDNFNCKQNFTLFINDEEQDIKEIKNSKCGYIFYLKVDKPFKLIYGMTDIRIEDDENILYSKPIVVAVAKTDDNDIVLKQMINEILLNERSFLKTKDYYRNTKNKIDLHKSTNLSDEIELLKTIVKIYNKNFFNFAINPYTKNSNSYSITKTEQLNIIDYKSLQYIANNPQNLRYHDKVTGIYYNKMPIIPEKTLVKNTIKDTNTYENQQILGFLKLILKYVDNKIKSIQKYSKQENIINTNYTVDSNYKLTTSIINSYIKLVYSNCDSDLVKIKKDIISLMNKYTKIFKISCPIINKIPKPTSVFMEIFHYRQIFSLIHEWFSVEKFNIPDPNILFCFPSADKIYEIYTIIHLYNCICDMGFKEKNRLNYSYESYNRKKVNYIDKVKFENTFEFKKDNITLILYYQPKIFSNINEFNNNIDLCRVNYFQKSDKYFIPDFIIKTITENDSMTEINYSIVDSKWSTMKTLKYYNVLKEMSYKYYLSILRTDNFKHISNLWLINGKDDKENKQKLIYRHYNNNFLQNQELWKNKLGIVTLTPNCDKSKFNEVIKHIIYN